VVAGACAYSAPKLMEDCEGWAFVCSFCTAAASPPKLMDDYEGWCLSTTLAALTGYCGSSPPKDTEDYEGWYAYPLGFTTSGESLPNMTEDFDGCSACYSFASAVASIGAARAGLLTGVSGASSPNEMDDADT
jgi:hypothetical protein